MLSTPLTSSHGIQPGHFRVEALANLQLEISLKHLQGRSLAAKSTAGDILEHLQGRSLAANLQLEISTSEDTCLLKIEID